MKRTGLTGLEIVPSFEILTTAMYREPWLNRWVPPNAENFNHTLLIPKYGAEARDRAR